MNDSLFTEIGSLFFNGNLRTEADLPDPESEEDTEATLTDKEYEAVSFVNTLTSLRFSGFGGNRIAFSIPESEKVILFSRWGKEGDTFTSGKAANNHEVRLYTNLSESDLEIPLLPIEEWDNEGLWVVKPNITPIPEESEEVKEKWEQYGSEELWDNIFPCSDHINMMDVTEANACMWNGEFTLFDYGTKPKEVE